MPREITFGFSVAWDFSNYVSETAYLVSATGDMSYNPPGDGFTSGRGYVSSMTVTLDNSSGRYSALNTGSAIYTHIRDGKAYHAPCFLQVSIDGGATYHRIFTGVIKYPKPVGGTSDKNSLVTIEARSNEELILQSRTSTTLADFVTYYETSYDEGQLITDWLTNAGIDSGDMEIDAGLLRIPWAWLDDESPIEEIWRLSAACGGRFYCTPEGKYRYESATFWLSNAESVTSQESINNDDFSEFEYEYDDRDLFDSVLVEAAPREPLSADVLWEPDEPVRILPGETKLITARLRQPAYTIDEISWTALSAGGTNITGSVTLTPVYFAQRVEMTIANAHATHTAYIDPLEIIGRTVSGSITIEEERNAADHGTNGAFFTIRGSRRKSVRGNVYVQSRAHAAMIAEFLMRQTETPKLSFSVMGCPGNPERRLGWKVSVSDETIMSTGKFALITGIRWRLNDSGFSQDLQLIDYEGLFPNDDYFVIGTSKLGASGADIGKLFF